MEQQYKKFCLPDGVEIYDLYACKITQKKTYNTAKKCHYIQLGKFKCDNRSLNTQL